MIPISIPGSRLDIPRQLNGADLAPEGSGGAVSFNIGAIGIQRNPDGKVAVAFFLPNQTATFACVFLSDSQTAQTVGNLLLDVAA